MNENITMNADNIYIKTKMKHDGVHVFIDGELKLIVDNDPDDLIIRTPSSGSSRTMFSVDDAVVEVFGACDRQEQLGLVALLSMCIFSSFEDQSEFINRISQ